MTKIVQIIPCSDWYLVGEKNDVVHGIVEPLAAWALLEDGTIIGLIVDHETNQVANRLTLASNIKEPTHYAHINELSAANRALAGLPKKP
ncbi:hypothetical protein [Pseudomonas sp. Fl4BN1]|uniref:hypothetical protein n=1 Tax=Pseudomonas sp. Fl4BN1 TaxID=2697651 RepID=UPI0013785F96|nr:hypothetical protein [Pseudomonas sp. Fl4BN1]NBF12844.1 hypothetical protein [Pseudomonas sp. Fl4BN1]